MLAQDQALRAAGLGGGDQEMQDNISNYLGSARQQQAMDQYALRNRDAIARADKASSVVGGLQVIAGYAVQIMATFFPSQETIPQAEAALDSSECPRP